MILNMTSWTYGTFGENTVKKGGRVLWAPHNYQGKGGFKRPGLGYFSLKFELYFDKDVL